MGDSLNPTSKKQKYIYDRQFNWCVGGGRDFINNTSQGENFEEWYSLVQMDKKGQLRTWKRGNSAENSSDELSRNGAFQVK